MIAGRDRSGRAGRADEGREAVVAVAARELGALVVDLLHIALAARRADDVGGIGYPSFQPVEPLPTHPGRQHRDAAAAEDARDRNPTAAVVAGRRPDRPVANRVEAAGDEARHEATI